MFCPNCGKEYQEGIRFCGSCGFKVDVTDNKEKKIDTSDSSKVEIGNIQINVDEIKAGTESIKNATISGANTVKTVVQEAFTDLKKNAKEVSNNTSQTAQLHISSRLAKSSRPKKNFKIGWLIPVGLVAIVCVVIGVNRSKPEGEAWTIDSIVEGTGLKTCKYEGCEETELFRDGYCDKHYALVEGSGIVGDILNGEQTCKYAGCNETEIYDDGYCKEHYVMLQAKSGIDTILSGTETCKYTNCDSTDIYQEGYCRVHFFASHSEELFQGLVR